jgi:hypothetical protein
MSSSSRAEHQQKAAAQAAKAMFSSGFQPSGVPHKSQAPSGAQAPPRPAAVSKALPPAAAPEGSMGLENLGNTCYLNATLSCLLTCPPIARVLLDDSLRAAVVAALTGQGDDLVRGVITEAEVLASRPPVEAGAGAGSKRKVPADREEGGAGGGRPHSALAAMHPAVYDVRLGSAPLSSQRAPLPREMFRMYDALVLCATKWLLRKAIAPDDLRFVKAVFGSYVPEMGTYAQQDAHEALALALTALHEELERVAHVLAITTGTLVADVATARAAHPDLASAAFDAPEEEGDMEVEDLSGERVEEGSSGGHARGGGARGVSAGARAVADSPGRQGGSRGRGRGRSGSVPPPSRAGSSKEAVGERRWQADLERLAAFAPALRSTTARWALNRALPTTRLFHMEVTALLKCGNAACGYTRSRVETFRDLTLDLPEAALAPAPLRSRSLLTKDAIDLDEDEDDLTFNSEVVDEQAAAAAAQRERLATESALTRSDVIEVVDDDSHDSVEDSQEVRRVAPRSWPARSGPGEGAAATSPAPAVAARPPDKEKDTKAARAIGAPAAEEAAGGPASNRTPYTDGRSVADVAEDAAAAAAHPGRLTLLALLNTYFGPRVLRLKCPVCRDREVCVGFTLTALPRVLILQLKRFSWELLKGGGEDGVDTYRLVKRMDPVVFPTVLPLSRYVPRAEAAPFQPGRGHPDLGAALPSLPDAVRLPPPLDLLPGARARIEARRATILPLYEARKKAIIDAVRRSRKLVAESRQAEEEVEEQRRAKTGSGGTPAPVKRPSTFIKGGVLSVPPMRQQYVQVLGNDEDDESEVEEMVVQERKYNTNALGKLVTGSSSRTPSGTGGTSALQLASRLSSRSKDSFSSVPSPHGVGPLGVPNVGEWLGRDGTGSLSSHSPSLPPIARRSEGGGATPATTMFADPGFGVYVPPQKPRKVFGGRKSGASQSSSTGGVRGSNGREEAAVFGSKKDGHPSDPRGKGKGGLSGSGKLQMDATEGSQEDAVATQDSKEDEELQRVLKLSRAEGAQGVRMEVTRDEEEDTRLEAYYGDVEEELGWGRHALGKRGLSRLKQHAISRRNMEATGTPFGDAHWGTDPCRVTAPFPSAARLEAASSAPDASLAPLPKRGRLAVSEAATTIIDDSDEESTPRRPPKSPVRTGKAPSVPPSPFRQTGALAAPEVGGAEGESSGDSSDATLGPPPPPVYTTGTALSRPGPVYDLTSVLRHQGSSAQHGHYTADTRAEFTVDAPSDLGLDVHARAGRAGLPPRYAACTGLGGPPPPPGVEAPPGPEESSKMRSVWRMRESKLLPAGSMGEVPAWQRHDDKDVSDISLADVTGPRGQVAAYVLFYVLREPVHKL